MEQESVVVLTTLPADGDAGAFARRLIEERLAACVNVLPAMESFYRWEGAVEEGTERQVIIKTLRARVPALWERVCDTHPYDVPEFVVLPVIDGNAAYLAWISDSTTPNGKT